MLPGMGAIVDVAALHPVKTARVINVVIFMFLSEGAGEVPRLLEGLHHEE
jgi:hypothetical protein